MKRFTFFATILISISAAFIVANLSSTASAQQPSNQPGGGQALEIAPPLIDVSADPGQTINTRLQLRDVASTPLIVTSEINDFVADGEDGTPRILLDENEDPDNPYSLKEWIAPFPQLTLQPGEIQDLPVSIKVPANASPGGYYGVIRFTATPPDLEGTGVSLSASLGALVLLRVNGDADIDLKVEEFMVSKNGEKAGTIFNSAPVMFSERIKNAGNVHMQPVGRIVISDMFGNEIAGVNVNLSKKNILPDSIRRFDQSLDKSVIGNKILFGRYTAEFSVPFENDIHETLTAKTTFWIIPYKMIAIIAAVLIVLYIAMRHTIKRYNRYIINQARKKKKKKKK